MRVGLRSAGAREVLRPCPGFLALALLACACLACTFPRARDDSRSEVASEASSGSRMFEQDLPTLPEASIEYLGTREILWPYNGSVEVDWLRLRNTGSRSLYWLADATDSANPLRTVFEHDDGTRVSGPWATGCGFGLVWPEVRPGAELVFWVPTRTDGRARLGLACSTDEEAPAGYVWSQPYASGDRHLAAISRLLVPRPPWGDTPHPAPGR